MAKQPRGWYTCIYNDNYLQWWNGSAWLSGYWPKNTTEPPRPNQPNTWPYFLMFLACLAAWTFLPHIIALIAIGLILAISLYRWNDKVSAVPRGSYSAIPEQPTDGNG